MIFSRARRPPRPGAAWHCPRSQPGRRAAFRASVKSRKGSTGHWPVPSGDSPDGMERGVPVEIQAKVSPVVKLFRSASRRSERAGRPYPVPETVTECRSVGGSVKLPPPRPGLSRGIAPRRRAAGSSELGVSHPVAEINHDPDEEPDDQPDPGHQRQGKHERKR